jgi:hypothetical protein
MIHVVSPEDLGLFVQGDVQERTHVSRFLRVPSQATFLGEGFVKYASILYNGEPAVSFSTREA